MGGVGGGYLCTDDFQDRKYPEALTKEMRRSVFRMGNLSFKLRNFSQRSKSVPSFRVLLATNIRETIHPLDEDIQASQGEANTTARQEILSRLLLEQPIENDQCGICAKVNNGIGLELTWKSSVTYQRTSNWRLLL